MKRHLGFTLEDKQRETHMPGTRRRDNMGKVQDNSTPSSTNPVEDSYSGIPLGMAQDTDIRSTIVNILKEVQNYKEQIKQLRKENEKLKKDIERENDKLQKEVETLKRFHVEKDKETNQ